MQLKLPQILQRLAPYVRLSRVHVTALAVAGVSSIVLLAYWFVNPDREAEEYYKHSNATAHRVMQACYVVILASAAFNLRFVVLDVAGSALRKFSSSK